MKYFAKVNKQGNRQPNYVASSVADIDFSLLKSVGIKCVAFDIDGTLTKNNSLVIDTKLAKTIKDKLDKAGIKKRFLASNSGRSLHAIADSLGAFEMHQPTNGKGKPSGTYYAQLVKKSGFKPSEIAMIGDRMPQDIWGANKAGLVSVLVAIQPQYATFRDKIIGRHWWQPYFVRNKAK